MPTSSIVAFWAVSVVLIVVPGPDWAFAISSGLRGRVLPAAGGIVLGYWVMTLVVAAGVGAPVAASPAALTILTIIGGGYLIWLGGKILAHPASPSAGDERARTGAWATVVQGVAVSGLNPKGLLIFVAMIPQFTGRTRRGRSPRRSASWAWSSWSAARLSTCSSARWPAQCCTPGRPRPARSRGSPEAQWCSSAAFCSWSTSPAE